MFVHWHLNHNRNGILHFYTFIFGIFFKKLSEKSRASYRYWLKKSIGGMSLLNVVNVVALVRSHKIKCVSSFYHERNVNCVRFSVFVFDFG